MRKCRGGMGLSAFLRAAAVSCYQRAGKDRVKAATLMRQECGDSCPDHTARFIGSCVARYEELHSFKDRRRSGRPPKVPAETAARLASILKEGKGDGQRFCDIMDAVVSDGELERQVAQANATKRTLQKAVKKADPKLKHVSVAMKPRLSAEQKEQRRAAAAKLLRRGAKKLKWTVFVDEASCEVVPLKKRKEWIEEGEEPPPAEDPNKRNFKPEKLKWEGSVMYGLGAVEFQLLTGTTHFDPPYEVGPWLSAHSNTRSLRHVQEYMMQLLT